MGNIILADEINRTSPKTQASMLEAMEERRVTVDGKGHELPYPFVVIATQNPVMQRGTYYLPESQLDRFMMKLSVGYPDIRQSIQIVKNQIEGKTVNLMDNVAGTEEWSELIKQAGEVAIKDELIVYAAECIECTRNHEKVQLGASPRALLSWIKAAKSYAYVCGRGYVIPDDLKALAYVVLCHRIILKQNTDNDDEEVRRIITEVLGKVKVPIG